MPLVEKRKYHCYLLSPLIALLWTGSMMGQSLTVLLFLFHWYVLFWLHSTLSFIFIQQNKFHSFYQYAKCFNSDTFNYDELKNTDYVFMRWKVRLFWCFIVWIKFISYIVFLSWFMCIWIDVFFFKYIF